jgi:HSP20 family protein
MEMSFLMKPDPFSTEVNRLFNTLFAPGEARTQRWTPAMDLVEADDHYLLRADLPGMAEEDVSIEIQDNVLTVSGERRDEQEHTRQGWHRVERTFGRFSRSLTLPEGIDPSAVKADFDKGVLTITVPKPEERKPRRVQISVGGAKPAVEGSSRESIEPAGADAGAGNGASAERAPAEGEAAVR